MAVTHTGKSRSTARKSPPAVAAAPKAAAPKKTATRKTVVKTPGGAMPTIDRQMWQQMVAFAAYLRAEARGFAGGSPEQDWFEAEAELMAKFGTTPFA